MKTLQTVCKELLERIKHMERDREKLEYKTKFMGSDIYNIYNDEQQEEWQNRD